MRRNLTFAFIFLFALIFSSIAIAEKFMISATSRNHLIVASCELKPNNRINIEHLSVIKTEYDTYNLAVTFRKSNNSPIFDIYTPVATEYDGSVDLMELYRLDSNLKVKFEKEFIGLPSNGWTLDIARLEGPLGPPTHFLITGTVEFELNANGAPGPQTVVFQLKRNSWMLGLDQAEDGKMIVAVTANTKSQRFFQVRKLHPAGPIKVKQIPNHPLSLALSNPINVASNSHSAGPVAGSHRFLFFRDFPNWEEFQSTRIVMQKIDDSTGKFIGPMKVFTTTTKNLNKVCCVGDQFYQSVAVSPAADIIFYSDFDASCGKNVLKAQVFNPQKQTKIGQPQLLIGCGQLVNIFNDGIYGIDVVQFEP